MKHEERKVKAITTNDKELVKVIVAVKNYRKDWYCKQVIVHGIHSKLCFIKDIVCYIIAGHIVGWYAEGLSKSQKWFEDGRWDYQLDKHFNPYAPIVNMDYLSHFPEYTYSAYNLYPYNDIFQYLRIYEQYPQAEYLVKAGLYNYATSKMILRKIGKDKPFRKWLLRNIEEIKHERVTEFIRKTWLPYTKRQLKKIA